MDLYAENILDHYRHPRNKEALASPTVTHEEKNLSCGDEVRLSLKIEDDRIVSLGWEGDGCAISQAGISMLGEELIGKTTEEAAALTSKHVRAMLGVHVGERRLKCAFLGLHTLQNALRVHRGLPPQGWNQTVNAPE
jgi:nitrogen fixation NifU-like protein